MLLHTLPDGQLAELPTFPEPMPPTGIFGATDPTYGDGDIRAVVTVQIAVTRDMLFVALDLACGACDEHPDTWSVDYIRESVEMMLTHEGMFELEQYAEGLEQFDASVAERVEATYQAVDRAYPQLAPKADR